MINELLTKLFEESNSDAYDLLKFHQEAESSFMAINMRKWSGLHALRGAEKGAISHLEIFYRSMIERGKKGMTEINKAKAELKESKNSPLRIVEE